jgi:hypothetical protein
MIELGSDMAEGGIKDAASAEMTLEDDRHGHVACGRIIQAGKDSRCEDFD